MKDWFIAVIIYTLSFFIAHATMMLVANVTPLIENPDTSMSDLLFTALFMIPAMVIFDKLFIRNNR